MQLARYPRGRDHARTYDSRPVRHGENSDAATPGPRPAPSSSDWVGWRATDELGRTVGRIEGTIDDDWLIIRDRRSHHLIAPASDAIGGGSAVFLPFGHDTIEAAPQVGSGEAISEALLAEARAHYGVGTGA